MRDDSWPSIGDGYDFRRPTRLFIAASMPSLLVAQPVTRQQRDGLAANKNDAVTRGGAERKKTR